MRKNLLNSKLSLNFLTKNFIIHELLKENQKNKHYIVEDLEADQAYMSDQENHVFYYLKQIILHDPEEYKFTLQYYKKLFEYCQTPFAKSDIIKLNNLFNFDNNMESYYEIVILYEFGESDRIDVENIEKQHINKFLKNACLLLKDLKKFDNIYHGNIFLRNIVLVNNELKISGFKPVYID